MAYRVLLLAAFLLGTTGPAMAATLGIAWDASSEPSLIGYRVFVGMSPGRYTESFEVGPYQTSFYYRRAMAGQRYYFSVVTLVPGTASDKSREVSAVAEEPEGVAAAPGPVQSSLTAVGVNARPLRDSPISLEHGSPEAFAAVTEIASGLGEITSIAAMPIGVGLLVEHGSALRPFSDRGVGGLAYRAPAGTRIAGLAVDQHFETTGLVYLAETRPALGGDEVWIVRHRLLAGVLGESATIVSAGLQPSGTAVALAITASGDVILAQGRRATRFRPDGGIVRRWPTALDIRGTDVTLNLAWDGQRGGLWHAGFDGPSDLTVSFVPLGDDASGRMTVAQPVGESPTAAGVAVLGATVRVALASQTTVFRFDPAAVRLSSGTSVARYGTVVSLAVAEPAADFAVVREPTPDKAGHASYSLLRVRHANLP